jgi:AraC family transcriptional regulator
MLHSHLLLARLKPRTANPLGKNCDRCSMRHVVLAFGSGWSVSDVLCTAGPNDAPFEERHENECIAVVTEGTFQCRSTQGSAVLTPGALFLGNIGGCFECGHEHAVGDRCTAFHYSPDLLEGIASGTPEVRSTTFSAPRVPAMSKFVALIAAAEVARDERDSFALDELSIRLAGAALAILANSSATAADPSRRDEKRVTAAVRWIEKEAQAPQSLVELAGAADMSPYHFIRVFARVTGLTPYQYVLHTRLHRAAVRLREADEPILSIALDAGFNDLSTFNRRFRSAMGCTPGAFRAGIIGSRPVRKR